MGSGAALVIGGSLGVNLVGYALGSIVTILLIALHRRATERRRFEEGIGTTRGLRVLATVVLASGVVLSGIHAYLIGSRFG